MKKKTFKMTRDEVIEELMDEWWNSLEGNVAEDMISVYLDEVGAELEEDTGVLVKEMKRKAKENNKKYLERKTK